MKLNVRLKGLDAILPIYNTISKEGKPVQTNYLVDTTHKSAFILKGGELVVSNGPKMAGFTTIAINADPQFFLT